ncbi:unnamed protein product [Nippostrongylus brasiliensis]|uniref:Secreted protein n=1 Tax=Nippostrongylus brasiliensis TaxID=27835 RepID=A0A0N4Y5Z1_NIPBR|nr:unnamed protein product [Nippostrongylus brasiliensis]
MLLPLRFCAALSHYRADMLLGMYGPQPIDLTTNTPDVLRDSQQVHPHVNSSWKETGVALIVVVVIYSPGGKPLISG